MRRQAIDPDAVLRDVGHRIAELRRGVGETQEKFATRADLSWKYVQQIEAGSENLTIRSLVRLANLLRVGPSDLFAAPIEVERRLGRPGRAAPKVRAPSARGKNA